MCSWTLFISISSRLYTCIPLSPRQRHLLTHTRLVTLEQPDHLDYYTFVGTYTLHLYNTPPLQHSTSTTLHLYNTPPLQHSTSRTLTLPYPLSWILRGRHHDNDDHDGRTLFLRSHPNILVSGPALVATAVKHLQFVILFCQDTPGHCTPWTTFCGCRRNLVLVLDCSSAGHRWELASLYCIIALAQPSCHQHKPVSPRI